MAPDRHRAPRPPRVALVTGGSRGIGAAICRELGRDHHVLVGGRDLAAIRHVVEELPSAEPFHCDLTDERATSSAAAAVDRLDVLVHSAAVAPRGPWHDLTRADWRDVLETNLVAVVDLTRLLVPALRENRGDVVFINSGAGFTVPDQMALYAASKFALRAFADGLREEERGRVRVTTIHPGPTDTAMQHRLTGDDPGPAGRSLKPESVAATVRLALAASPEAMVETLSVRPVATR